MRASCAREEASAALRERLDALSRADERGHHEHAEREQHSLEDVRALIAEPEQDRERPAAGKRRAEHFGAIRIAAEMTVMTLGQMIAPEEVEAGCGLMEKILFKGRNLSEKAPSIKLKRPKNAASRDIDCRIFSRKRREL